MFKLFKAALKVGAAIIGIRMIEALAKYQTSHRFVEDTELETNNAWSGNESPRRLGNNGGFFARWSETLRRVFDEIGTDRVLAVAGGVTFYGLLALFPAITAFVSIYGIFADRATLMDHLAILQSFLPEGAITIISEQLLRILATPNSSLSLAFVFGLGLALWSANAGMKAMMEALNVAYDEAEKRSYLMLNLQSLLFTFLAILFLTTLVFGIAVVPVVLNFLWLGSITEWILWAGRWPIIFCILIFSLSALYRYGPSRANSKWHWITPGSIVAALGLVGFSLMFSWYATNFGSYNETYGSLGAAIVFMTWMWLSSTIILIGAEIDAEIETQYSKTGTNLFSAKRG